MGLFVSLAAGWFSIAVFALMISANSRPRMDWLRARERYNEDPSDRNKKWLAVRAEQYIKERKRVNYIWLWPISLPIVLVILIAKAPHRVYRFFKNNEGDYAKARMDMKGEI